MTVIVGIPYHDGLVMASDLLTTDENGKRSETNKLYYNDKLIIGTIGVASDSAFKKLEKKVQHWHSVNYVLKYGFRRFVSSTLDWYFDLDALLGVNNTGEFELWKYISRRHGDISFAGYEGHGLVLRPGITLPSAEEWLLCDDLDSQKTIELAMSKVRYFTQLASGNYSGLEILHMTTNGVTRVAYESISK